MRSWRLWLRGLASVKPGGSFPCDWSALRDSSRLLRRGRGVALCVTEGLESLELTIGNGTVENLWMRIKGQTNNAISLWESALDLPARMMTLTNYSLRN